MIIDKGVDDEVLVLQTFGIQIDIAALIEEINSNSDQFLIHECETEILLGINRTDGINVEVLKNIKEARLNQPILVTAIDDSEWVIDGNHRLLKRQELGRKMTNYIPINGSQLDPFVSEFS
ncbi:MAG: ParB/Srx family N-terminal domain-containing protein [Reinekea sp.]